MELKVEKKTLAFKLAFASIMASNFIGTMDTVIVATGLPAISLGLNAKSNEAYWLGSGFLFAQAVSQPLYGILSNVLGRKPCFLTSIVLFTVASVFCATARSIAWLTIARVFQGLGAGGIFVVGSILVTDMVSLHERGKYIGIIASASALGLVSGIIIGAAIGGLASWRLIFWINLPLCIPSIAGVYFFIHLTSEPGSRGDRLRRADWIGMVILTGSLIALLYGITSGGVLHAWKSGTVIASIAVGLSGTVVFSVHEGLWAKEPVIPLRIFKSRTAGSAYVGAFSLGFVLWAMQYYLILYFLVTKEHSLLGAGVCILPGTLFVPVSAVVGGFIISKLQKFRTVNSVSWLLVTVGFSLMTRLSIASPSRNMFGFQVIYAIGAGVLFPGRMCAVQASEKDEDVPMATAMVSFMGSLGSAFGVAIGGVVFQNEWARHVHKHVSTGKILSEYIISSDQAEHVGTLMDEFPSAVQTIYRVIMADTIDTLFTVLAAFSAAAFVVSLGSRNLSLSRETKSSQQFEEKVKAQDSER
ncbi:major facilitator superfamily domain-containing protein [Phaeosphaeria sp. MPI-PUGE-AT-0046c]|nr:major facilitator superfamily domain-containing protein [Phaeosphaeria sp. MPI-PUGE-AT-0046c]